MEEEEERRKEKVDQKGQRTRLIFHLSVRTHIEYIFKSFLFKTFIHTYLNEKYLM